MTVNAWKRQSVSRLRNTAMPVRTRGTNDACSSSHTSLPYFRCFLAPDGGRLSSLFSFSLSLNPKHIDQSNIKKYRKTCQGGGFRLRFPCAVALSLSPSFSPSVRLSVCLQVNGSSADASVVPNKAVCLSLNASWVNSNVNFDNTLQAALALYQVVSHR